jgi:hypothetical protein
MSKNIQFEIHTDPKKIEDLIKSIAKVGAKLDRDIQVAGLSALMALREHGNVHYVNSLYLAMPKGSRKAALTSWFLSHGQLSANTDKDKNTKPFIFTKDKDVTNVEAAMADPWYNHKPDQNPDEVFDLRKAVEAVIKKAQGKNLAHGELLEQLQSMVKEEAPAGDDSPSGEGQPE